MVTTDENGILRDLEREESMLARQLLLKKLWRLRGFTHEAEGAGVAGAKGRGAVAKASATHHQRAAASADANLDLGVGD